VLTFGLDDIDVDATLLSETERQRAEQFVTELLGRRFRAARTVLRLALAGATGERPEALALVVDQHGKPWLPSHPEVHFNVSHSVSQGLIALGPVPLGVDIEAVAARHADNDSLARWVLEPDAAEAWLQADALRRAEMLCRAWTLKEAYVKARGTGLGHDAFSTLVLPSSGYGPIAPGAEGTPAWWVQALPAPWGYHAALSTHGLPPAVRCFRLNEGAWNALL
jgi:4'-phosphopantetheinyl transferase